MKNEFEKYKLIFNESTDALIITDGKSGHIVDVNDACLTLLGYTKDEMLGESYKMLFPHQGFSQIALSADKIKMFDNVLPGKLIQKKDGTKLLMDLTITNIIEEDDKLVLSCFRDATERVKTEEALEEYAEKLAKMNASKDKLFSIIAHDLKNPFVTLLGFVEILQEDFITLNDKEKLDFISEIEKVAKNSHQLLENLLTWSQSQLGRIQADPGVFKLKGVVDKAFEQSEGQAKNKTIELVNSVDENLECLADDSMVLTILRNLIANAIKFSEHGKRVEVNAADVIGKCQISVKDEGIGMDDVTVAQLFKLEANISTLGTDSEKGTGLGLILCEDFVAKNKGEIWCESESGTGSTFHFTVPMKTPF